ncbi:sigma-54-dependent transcriptional regulator [Celeribacter neptunius]|uniref:DNA-binding transcriptional response regulator, NtrC family, contains REC, AAA-type ATPase, and a Fis-type DNA-binding domains n=1 Tax=Celeribacter neptunius TaxID=588602 RepID=A0A1I3W8I1_9RHOB|nr:sigma-54 dependent transcriptional regulator [Celeribacter neptunius]SFK03898.1 DNA-binding transcriptional response regulator, NtrC family, contains REC, AAA-type ATPase, and a Fis-type DNA-binding domains [Celeribacter neptunius]
MSRTPILIVDDVETHVTLFTSILEEEGYEVLAARSRAEALALAETAPPSLALVDLVLPDGDGVSLIDELLSRNPDLKPIAITAFASVDRAVAAMRNGAVDFLVKPISPEQLTTTITNAVTGRSIGQLPEDSRNEVKGFEGEIGSSAVMRDVFDTLSAVAGSAASVFITGENGTGKVKAAATVHAKSGFRDGELVRLDCSTTPPDQIEAALVGALKGPEIAAQTGAVERADGGTLFLDEVCALPLCMQARLLNILQSGSVTPVGGVTPIPISFRLICTATPDPQTEVSEGRFRADLFYRINVVPIHLPPLRTRGMDVIEIAESELDRLCAREARAFRTLSTEVKAVFLDHDWPGNVRELMNVLWNVVMLHDKPMVELADLPPYLRAAQLSTRPKGTNGATPPRQSRDDAPSIPLEGRTLAEIEREVIEAAILAAGGSIPAAARVLDVSPSTLYRKLENWGKPVRGFRKR